MTRLPFVLPDFTRIGWVSDAAKDYWGPIVAQIGEAWHRLERETVYQGVRAAAITECRPDGLADLIVEAAERGVTAVPLEVTANTGYASSSQPARAGQPSKHRVALVRTSDAKSFRLAWQAGDHDTMGGLLGFPSCCRAFFQQVWIRDRRIDTTWQQASRTDASAAVDVMGYHSEANVLGRWMGVRAVPHLPCAFTCEPTVAFGQAWRALAVQLGYGETWDALDAITRWPVAWSGLKGIATIKTPVWTIVARTDATAELVRVHVHGSDMPAHASTGLVFPYPRATPSAPDPRAWTDNGFSSQAAMQRAHAVIVETVKAWKPVPGPVLDLGCGNGMLARKLATGRRGGVDLAPDKIARAQGADPHGAYVVGDVRDPTIWPAGDWGLTVCMVGRLLEGEAAAARAALTGPVAFYAYSDWLKGRSLDALLQDIGHGHRRVVARRETPDAAVVVVE